MMASLAWKEYREHRGVWLTMAAVAGLGLFAVRQLAAGWATMGDPAAVVVPVGWLLVWGYGVVCGAMLLAGEREEGTLAFLDGLPGLRRQLWTAKCLIGIGLVLGQAAVVTAVTLGLNALGGARELAAAGTAIAYGGVTGLGWGLLFSASGDHVLRVIGEAIGAQILTTLGLLLLLTANFRHQDVALLLGHLGLTVLAFVGSWHLFSRTDRLRRARAYTGERLASWRVLLWLCWQQTHAFARILLAFSVAAGLVVMGAGAVLWPATTLFVGVLCGVTVFAGEQAGGAFRFLGDQRLPPGRIWLAKTCVRLILALVCTLLVFLPVVVRSLVLAAETDFHKGPPTLLGWLFRDPVLGEVAAPGAFLLLFVLNGFGIGQLCGMVVRKSVVAGFLALGASGLAVCVWLPSLVGGNLHLWQVVGVPALALAGSRLLLPAWTAGRLSGARAAGGVASVTGAAALWVAAGLAFRVVEIPDTPDLLNMPAFRDELPAQGRNEAGELTRRACEGLSGRLRELAGRRPAKPLFPDGKPGVEREHLPGQPGEVLERGWPGGEPDLGPWLDQVFAARWPGELARAAALPPGVVEDPRKLTVDSPLRLLEPARTAGLLLAVHGLREQARGNDAAFVADLRTGLALSRNLRNHSLHIMVLAARAVEEQLLVGLDRWLERLHGRPDLLRETLEVLRKHEDELPDDPTDTQRAEFLVVENSLKHPAGWLAHDQRQGSDQSSPALLAAVAVAWQVPWERERQRRLLRLRFSDNPFGEFAALRAAPWMRELSAGVRLSEESDRQRAELAALRARRLEVALRLYQAEKGKPAATLDALVPACLPAVPPDPFDSQPFRYRLSAGERIEWPGTEPDQADERQVPAGQGILWSVGKDGADDGGRRQGSGRRSERGTDLIFLVPLPPGK